MNKNKIISKSNLINLTSVCAVFALIGFCCWVGNSKNTLASNISPTTITQSAK